MAYTPDKDITPPEDENPTEDCATCSNEIEEKDAVMVKYSDGRVYMCDSCQKDIESLDDEEVDEYIREGVERWKRTVWN